MSVVTISASGLRAINFDGSQDAKRYILRGLHGWLDSTASKTQIVERQAGDGAHAINQHVWYEARTVTIEYRLMPDGMHDRGGLLAMQAAIRAYLHHEVTIRVQDADSDLYCQGYIDHIEVEQSVQNINRQYMNGQIVMICPSPQLLSTSEQQFQLIPRSMSGIGLSYGEGLVTWWTGEPNNSPSVCAERPTNTGLAYPLDYGDSEQSEGRVRGIFENHGSSPAYPMVIVQGDWPHGVAFTLTDGHDTYQLAYNNTIEMNAPLALDFSRCAAIVDNTDMSRFLTKRAFPPVPEFGSLGIVLRSEGTGYVQCLCNDTYM